MKTQRWMPPFPAPSNSPARAPWICPRESTLEIQDRPEPSVRVRPLLRQAGFQADTVDDERITGADDSLISERSGAAGRW